MSSMASMLERNAPSLVPQSSVSFTLEPSGIPKFCWPAAAHQNAASAANISGQLRKLARRAALLRKEGPGRGRLES